MASTARAYPFADCIREVVAEGPLPSAHCLHATLQWTLPKPYFVTIAAGVNYWDKEVPLVRYLNGIATYNIASGKFKFNCQHFSLLDVETRIPPFEVEGLILCHNLNEERGVFNVHTQTWHAIPPGPKQSETLSASGLLVNTTVRPYTFKLIEGDLNFRTQIYDSKSRSWTRTSSRLPSSYAESRRDTLEYSCICHNDNVYMSLGTHMIWKYSVEDDKWTKLESPTLKNSVGRSPLENTLGIWEGRIFTTRERYLKQRVTLWELVNLEGQEWVEYARMPKELYKWVWKCDIDVVGRHIQVGLRSFFCEGYLLVCCWRWNRGFADAFAMFDIATKIWQKVDLPRRIVAIDEQEYESSHESQDVDEDEDVDEVYYVGERPHVPYLFHENVDEDEDTDEEDHADEYVEVDVFGNALDV